MSTFSRIWASYVYFSELCRGKISISSNFQTSKFWPVFKISARFLFMWAPFWYRTIFYIATWGLRQLLYGFPFPYLRFSNIASDRVKVVLNCLKVIFKASRSLFKFLMHPLSNEMSTISLNINLVLREGGWLNLGWNKATSKSVEVEAELYKKDRILVLLK